MTIGRFAKVFVKNAEFGENVAVNDAAEALGRSTPAWNAGGTGPERNGTASAAQGRMMEYPVTPAIRVLREKKADFVPHLYDYVEKGGTRESARQLGVDEHAVVKTLVFETNEKKPLIVLMHGDREVSAKGLARLIGVKSVEPATPERASKLTGYLVGGTSPFGTKIAMPVYVEKSIFSLGRIYINGGKRGFLVEIEPKVLTAVLNVTEVEVGIGD